MQMKRLKLSEYQPDLGTLIDVEDAYTYSKGHHPNSINIPYNKLAYNYKTLLDKNKPYFIVCSGGVKSKRIVAILEFYGYNVTQLYKE